MSSQRRLDLNRGDPLEVAGFYIVDAVMGIGPIGGVISPPANPTGSKLGPHRSTHPYVLLHIPMQQDWPMENILEALMAVPSSILSVTPRFAKKLERRRDESR